MSSDREAASGSAGVRVFTAADVHRLLTYPSAIEALEAAFASLEMTAPPRSSVATDRGTVLLMPAFGDEGLGVKLVTLTPENPEAGLPFVQATYVLFDAATQSLRAVIDGSSLTAIRTAAVSALATRFLAAPDAHRLVIFGAGVQANSHLDAMRAVRPIDELVVVSRSPGAAEALVNRASAAGLRASVGAPEAVADADIVCTCTTSPDSGLRRFAARRGRARQRRGGVHARDPGARRGSRAGRGDRRRDARRGPGRSRRPGARVRSRDGRIASTPTCTRW